VHGLISDGTSFVFMWVPSYVGLADNSAAKALDDCLCVTLTFMSELF